MHCRRCEPFTAVAISWGGCLPREGMCLSGGFCQREDGVCPVRNVVSPQWYLFREWGVYLGGISEIDTPPMNRITDMCENITFPQLLLRTVITLKSMRSHRTQRILHRAVKFLASEENRIVCESFPLNLKILTKWLHLSIKFKRK